MKLKELGILLKEKKPIPEKDISDRNSNYIIAGYNQARREDNEVEIELDERKIKERIKSYFESLHSDYSVKVHEGGSVEIDGWFSIPLLARAIIKALLMAK